MADPHKGGQRSAMRSQLSLSSFYIYIKKQLKEPKAGRARNLTSNL